MFVDCWVILLLFLIWVGFWLWLEVYGFLVYGFCVVQMVWVSVSVEYLIARIVTTRRMKNEE